MPCDVCEGWEDRCASCKFNAKIDDARAEGAAAERDRVVAFIRARACLAAKHRHHPYGDGCDDCGREKALDDLLDWLEWGKS